MAYRGSVGKYESAIDQQEGAKSSPNAGEEALAETGEKVLDYVGDGFKGGSAGVLQFGSVFRRLPVLFPHMPGPVTYFQYFPGDIFAGAAQFLAVGHVQEMLYTH